MKKEADEAEAKRRSELEAKRREEEEKRMAEEAAEQEQLNKVSALLDDPPEAVAARDARHKAIHEARVKRDAAAAERTRLHAAATIEQEELTRKRQEKEAAEDAALPDNLPAWRKRKMEEERERARKTEAEKDARKFKELEVKLKMEVKKEAKEAEAQVQSEF